MLQFYDKAPAIIGDEIYKTTPMRGQFEILRSREPAHVPSNSQRNWDRDVLPISPPVITGVRGYHRADVGGLHNPTGSIGGRQPAYPASSVTTRTLKIDN